MTLLSETLDVNDDGFRRDFDDLKKKILKFLDVEIKKGNNGAPPSKEELKKVYAAMMSLAWCSVALCCYLDGQLGIDSADDYLRSVSIMREDMISGVLGMQTELVN